MPAAIHPHKNISLWQAGLAELVGTCIFTTTALGATATSTIHGEYTQIGLMHGIGIYVLATIFGPISGGHLNSAVSLTHLLNKRIDFKTFLVYVICQLTGGFIAGCIGYHLWFGVTHFNFYGKREVLPMASGFGLEFFGTFIQLLAVEYSSHRKVPNGPQIGGSMMFLVGVGGILKYATINPPKDFGPRLFGAIIFPDKDVMGRYWWVPVVAPFCASPVAVLVYKYLLAEKKDVYVRGEKDGLESVEMVK